MSSTNLAANADQESLVKAFESEPVTVDAPVVDVSAQEVGVVAPVDTSVPTIELHEGEMFGVLRIVRFGTDYEKPVFEATDEETLKKGVGHYIGTTGPCQIGNFAIAAHRTTYGAAFHDVELLQVGDEITIETSSVTCTYSVESTEVVDPSEVSVIAPVPGQPNVQPTLAYLTMTTCHPMYSDNERYVVHARLIEETVEY